MQNWTKADIPPQAGRLAVITGGTSGLGYQTALALARAGADVILTGSKDAEGREALARIRPSAPAALVRFEWLDLASLDSVAHFADRLSTSGRAIDLLINNAGVTALPRRQVTPDGFEMQFAANYLGHFALTARLLPLLAASRQPRVVQVSSLAHRFGRIDFDDLNGERRYRPWAAYCQSKLAVLLFALELQKRSTAHRWGVQSNSVHPGYAQTGPIANGGGGRSPLPLLSKTLGGVIGHSPEAGALPTLYAATEHRVKPGGFYGPQGPFELAGPPGEAQIADKARDAAVAQRLWAESERLTGVRWLAW